MLKLYGTRSSRAARSMWALEELGLKYEHVPLSTQGDSRKPEYLKVNPKGHVPALEDDGQVFWESMAVNLYLAEKYGKAPLWPSSVADHGHSYQWSLWAVTETEAHLFTLHRLRAALHRLRATQATALPAGPTGRAQASRPI
jgi:glutathione S-transferase